MLNPSFKIGKHDLSHDSEPLIIAEAGSNHNQSLETALRLVDVAARAGAHVVKFQLFRAEELYPVGTDMHKIFKSIELSADWVEKLNRHAKEQGIAFMASAFDKKSVDVLANVEVPAFKVASSETTNLPLLAYTARKGKPLLVSTGMCDLVDVSEAVTVCEETGNRDVALFQCGAMYPLPPEFANLKVMDLFSEVFGCPVGFSDHTLGIFTSIAAVARGARLIEKHFTLDRASPGPDHFYALEPQELENLVKGCKVAYSAIGSNMKQMLPEEKKVGRREGVYVTRDLLKDATIGKDDLALQRPAVGIRGRYRDQLMGARLKENVKAGTALQWKSIDL